jgi:hypothetical protein
MNKQLLAKHLVDIAEGLVSEMTDREFVDRFFDSAREAGKKLPQYKRTCPECGSYEIEFKEEHEDTEMDEIVGKCKKCGYSGESCEFKEVVKEQVGVVAGNAGTLSPGASADLESAEKEGNALGKELRGSAISAWAKWAGAHPEITNDDATYEAFIRGVKIGMFGSE